MKGHIDAPVDIQTQTIKLLAERIAVALFKAKSAPIEEKYRRAIAEFLLNEFDITEKQERMTKQQADALQREIERAAVNGKSVVRSIIEIVEEEYDVCRVCLGKTRVCFTCNLPEGSCTHVGYKTDGHLVICPVCNGTGKSL